MLYEITQDNFQKEVIESEKPVLIDLYADWCGPCKQMAPLVEEISQTNSDIKVCKVNVDDQPEIARAFGVQSIPTIIIVKDGKVKGSSLGAISKNKLLEFIKNHI